MCVLCRGLYNDHSSEWIIFCLTTTTTSLQDFKFSQIAGFRVNDILILGWLQSSQSERDSQESEIPSSERDPERFPTVGDSQQSERDREIPSEEQDKGRGTELSEASTHLFEFSGLS